MVNPCVSDFKVDSGMPFRIVLNMGVRLPL
ncbi:hypothetical protein KP509_01G116700 [Ceratopteris richardii]|nr:hypothetical protein KP509_01G116700 [Ceratopteris richardii]